jgi:hypothetical protein
MRLSREDKAIIISGVVAGVLFIFYSYRCNGFDVRSSDLDVLFSCLGSMFLLGGPFFYVYVKHYSTANGKK